MEINLVDSSADLSEVVRVLNMSHGTVAKEYNFSREDNPTNNAFIDESTLRKQLDNGIELYMLLVNKKIMGCIAIEKSKREVNTYYIEKVSVIPECRNRGYGIKLMNFAISKIKELEGESVSIALIDSNKKLKAWYSSQGFIPTGTKDFDHLPFRVCFMNRQI